MSGRWRRSPATNAELTASSLVRCCSKHVSSSVYIRWRNTKTTTSISGVSVTACFPFPDMTWTAQSGNNACWTVMARDTSQPDQTHPTSGHVLYAYKTTYTCTITAQNSLTTLPAFDFRTSTCYQSTQTWRSSWGYRLDYTIDGSALVSGPLWGQLN